MMTEAKLLYHAFSIVLTMCFYSLRFTYSMAYCCLTSNITNMTLSFQIQYYYGLTSNMTWL